MKDENLLFNEAFVTIHKRLTELAVYVGDVTEKLSDKEFRKELTLVGGAIVLLGAGINNVVDKK